MRYYKHEENGYILFFGCGSGFTEISREEFIDLENIARSKPAPPEGYDYWLKTDLTWELHELPSIPPEPEEEATAEDYEEALGRFGV